ncbi:platelet-activating factor acetylhydrolase IB subunit [Xanthomonas melonis]|uniref:Acetylhydrolase n=1 Tax=Xanthomonas melonis TaxID=56456 RepID=A0A2S7DDI8_9XANT|nr:platelet-activating factor acetylhydrolase IB subunit [Xanthomonas melonis]MCC4601301.1 GDSL-type esterase/lipase family protein [Xanthomonas melonis]PPU71850.1 acetylhydrolase [Xanthomonas melonis]
MFRSLHIALFRASLSAIALALMCGGLLLACATAGAQTPPPSIVPTDRLQEPWWVQRHAQVLEQVKQHPNTRLLLIGDSITQNYEKAKLPDEDFQSTWQTFYGSRGALNLGFSGDGTENLLWRLANGEVDGLQPKVALVLIGTNNTGHLDQSAEQTQLGIDAVVAALEQKLPRTHILLLSVLPSEISVEKSRRDAQVNQGLAVRYGDNPRVTYLEVSSVFQRGGALRTELFYDPRLRPAAGALHPDTQGQRMLAEAIEPTLARLLGEPPVKPVAELGRDAATSLMPVDWLEQDSYDWYARHHAALAEARTLKPEVVMIGDSITHFWAGPPQATRVSGLDSWQWLYGKRRVLNLGFGWDRTQNVLWRIRQGELDGLDPRWVVLHIGTNNLTGTAQARASTPAEAAKGVEAVVAEVRRRLPGSKLILMAIMPRGFRADSPLRAPIAETNRLLAARFARDPSVQLLDIGPRMLQPDGSLPEALMPDSTHPSDAGYRIWAQALRAAGITAGR